MAYSTCTPSFQQWTSACAEIITANTINNLKDIVNLSAVFVDYMNYFDWILTVFKVRGIVEFRFKCRIKALVEKLN
jgi:hypothetical protein